MPYRKFLPWNVAAGVLWGTGSALLGYFAGADFEAVARAMGWLGLVLFVSLILVLVGIRVFVRRRRGRAKR